MEKELLFALISTGLYLVGAIPLWGDLFRGRTIPHVFTHGLWFLLVGFNFFVLYKNHEWYSLIPTMLMVLSLSLCIYFGFQGFRKISINWFDWFCLFLGILLIFYWVVSKNIFNTVILTAIIDFIAFLPTFKKGWLQPWTETIIIYFMSSMGQLSTLFSIVRFENMENTVFWGYLFFANLVFFFMVLFRRWSLKGWKSIFE